MSVNGYSPCRPLSHASYDIACSYQDLSRAQAPPVAIGAARGGHHLPHTWVCSLLPAMQTSLYASQVSRTGYQRACEGSLSGLDIRNANNGAPPHYRILYLELRPRPMSREHARPQPPAGSRRYGGGAEEPAPVPVGVTGHRTQRPRGQVGPPGPHPAQPSSSLDPGGERWPIFRPLAPLIAQLVRFFRLLRAEAARLVLKLRAGAGAAGARRAAGCLGRRPG